MILGGIVVLEGERIGAAGSFVGDGLDLGEMRFSHGSDKRAPHPVDCSRRLLSGRDTRRIASR